MSILRSALLLRKAFKYEESVFNNLKNHVEGRTLSVGCGNGKIEKLFKDRKNIDITGVEVTKYNNPSIGIKLFNGKTLPFKDKEFDTSMFVYMLHHTDDIESLLRESSRVTRGNIIILDHIYSDPVSKSILKAYDYFSNYMFKMPIPFNFLDSSGWKNTFSKLNLKVQNVEVISPLNVFFKLASL